MPSKATANARMKLDRGPSDPGQIAQEGAQAWAVGHPGAGPASPWSAASLRSPNCGPKSATSPRPLGKLLIFFYAGFTYLMAGSLREQVCKYMCPLRPLPKRHVRRGYPDRHLRSGTRRTRGTRKKGTDLGPPASASASIAESASRSAPTGIDIRKGLQYECIGCAARGRLRSDHGQDELSPGLIRYSTENAMRDHLDGRDIVAHILRPASCLHGHPALIVGIAGWFPAHRLPVKVDAIRDRATLAREADDGRHRECLHPAVHEYRRAAWRYRIAVTGLDGSDRWRGRSRGPGGQRAGRADHRPGAGVREEGRQPDPF